MDDHTRRRLESLRERLTTKTDNLESLARGSAFDSGLESLGALDSVQADESAALRKVQSGDFESLSTREGIQLEAIVEREVRPVSFILSGTFENLPPPWTHFNSGAIRDRLNTVIPSVGRVEILGSNGVPSARVGTGFIVGEKLMMTNRHVAEVFVGGAGDQGLAFAPDSAVFNLGREADELPTDLEGTIKIIRVRMVHPYWDMALFELESLPDGVKPLALSVTAPEELWRREVVSIGYPTHGQEREAQALELQRHIFGDVVGVKRLAPGEIDGRGNVASYGRLVPAITYDSSTLGENSGAAIVDVNTGEVVGMHFKGATLEANFAVPMYELARDSRVVDAGVNFKGQIPPANEWEPFWLDPDRLAAMGDDSSGTEAPVGEAWTAKSLAAKGAEAPIPFADGEIARRLAQLQDDASEIAAEADRVQSFRQAAAVMAAFDPATLRNLEGQTLLSAKAASTALQRDMVPNPYEESDDDLPWSLALGSRKRALREMQSAQALQAALAANASELPDLPIQQMLSRAIQMVPHFDPDQMSVSDLSLLATVSDWLDGTEPGRKLPAPADLTMRIERQRDGALLNRLASDQFTGRVAELALLREHLEGTAKEVCFISGQGGLGKSALISQALLAWKGPPQSPVSAVASSGPAEKLWVRIDMDHSLVQPESPLSVLRHAARQINRTHPELHSLLQSFIESAGQQQSLQEEGPSETGTLKEANAESEFMRIVRLALHDPQQRLIFWLDTFEEAQFLGITVADQLLGLATRLAKDLPQMRVLVSGRAPPAVAEPEIRKLDEERAANSRPEPLPPLRVVRLTEPPLRVLLLDKLEASAATQLLTSLLKKLATPEDAAKLTPQVLQETAAMLGGHPLTLQLAARELQEKGPAALADLAGLREEVRQKVLLSRIATHLHEASLEKLLLPGMELRVITPDVVRHVLAGPCDLGILRPEQAWTLFDQLKREITLVEPETEGSHVLRYRQDIRLIMLAGQEKLSDQARQIHENALRWWQDPQRQQAAGAGPLPRAEALYHHLRLGHDVASLESLWQPEVGPLLRYTLDELPAASEQCLWLASKLKVVLATVGDGSAISQDAWEAQTTTEVQRLLQARQPQEALAALACRSDRLPGSALYALESRALLFSGQDQAAINVAMDGIAASRQHSPLVAVDLALLAGFIHERQGHWDAAVEVVEEAIKLAGVSGDAMLVLSAELRARRLERLAFERENAALRNAPKAPRLAPISPALKKAIQAVSEYDLHARSSVLRELAAEYGVSATQPAVYLRLASELLLDEQLAAFPVPALVDLLDRLGVLSAQEKSFFTDVTRHSEIVKLARSRILERLHQSPTRVLIPFYETLRNLYRQAVTGALHKEYQVTERTPAPIIGGSSELAPASITLASKIMEPSAVQREIENLRPLLIDLIAEMSSAILQDIARYVLEDDYARLSQHRDKRQTAEAMLNRALQFQRLPEVLRQLRKGDLNSQWSALLDRAEGMPTSSANVQ